MLWCCMKMQEDEYPRSASGAGPGVSRLRYMGREASITQENPARLVYTVVYGPVRLAARHPGAHPTVGALDPKGPDPLAFFSDA